MEDKDFGFDITKPLSSELLIISAGSDLYCIGLSHFRDGFQIRHKIHNPLLIAILSIMLLLRCILSLSLSDENPEVFIWIVNFS